MLLANSFDSSSLFVDKELDSAVESIRPFISLSKRSYDFSSTSFFNCLISAVHGTQANKVLDSPTIQHTSIPYVFQMTYSRD